MSDEEISFRDRITTVDEQGKRKWLFPKKPKGKLFNYRTYVSYLLVLLLFGLPWIKIHGEPFIMINVITRKFVLFGQVFWPQDFYLFALIMIVLVVFIVLFTTIFGRIFCGWVCPQTIFMEMVFRKIEYWIDGDSKQQIKLKKQKWNFDKIWKRGFKYSLFYLISLAIAHTFLAYIIGVDELIKIQTSPIKEHITGFIAMLIFSLIFFFVFAWFREQVCLIICPYGRLQGVMLDRNTLVVIYDYIRGERKTGREKFKKNENRQKIEKGDCIDCHQCVDVCPTGIDIRNGTQLECINCNACIDACNFMMEKVGQKKGLIRLDSENNVHSGIQEKYSTRSKAYTGLLLILIAIIVYLFSLRGALEVNILRTPGMLFQERGDTALSNLYNLEILNKSSSELSITLKLQRNKGKIEMIGNKVIHLKVGENDKQSFFVVLPKKSVTKQNNVILISVFNNGKLIKTKKTNFTGPELE